MRNLLAILTLFIATLATKAQDVGNLIYPHSFTIGSSHLKDGKIAYYQDPITISGSFGMTADPIYVSYAGQVETIIAVYDRTGYPSQANIIYSAPGPSFTADDFKRNGQLVYSTVLKPFNITIPNGIGNTFPSGTKVTVFYKYYFNPAVGLNNWNEAGWAPQVTHNKDWFISDKKQYEFIKVLPPTSFSGPSTICSEGIYTLTNPWEVTLQNATGIATLTELGNNQWKVTRTGTATGKVILRSHSISGTYEKEILVGVPLSGIIQGSSNITSPSAGYSLHTYQVDAAPGLTYNWSISGLTGVTIQDNNNSSIVVAVPRVTGTTNKTVTLTVRALSDCGLSENTLTKIITISPHTSGGGGGFPE